MSTWVSISAKSNSRNVLEIVAGWPAEKVAVGNQYKFGGQGQLLDLKPWDKLQKKNKGHKKRYISFPKKKFC